MINAIYSELVLVDTTFIMNEERNCGHKNLGKFLLNKVEILKNFCYNIIKNIKIYNEEVFSLSTVITYHTDAFNIMVCDTRKTTFTDDNKKIYDDSALKMHYIKNYGFISGIGVGELIQNTFNHFKSGDPFDGNLPCSFFSAYNDIASSCSKDVLERLKRTCVIVSSKNNIIFISKDLPFRDNSATLNANSIYINFPDDFDKQIMGALQKKYKHFQANVPLDALITILEVFQCISNNSEDVSSIACVSIMGSNADYPFYTQGKVVDLLSLLKSDFKETIPNLFEENKSKLLNW